MLRYLIIILVYTISITNLMAQKKFSRQQVLEDLAYLKHSLEEVHYNIYAYTTQEDFNKNYEHIKSSITADSLSLLETTSLFQAVISKANNGHTEIPFPLAPYIDYVYAAGTLFPIEIAFEEGKALIRKNWSGNEALPIGAEITRINDMAIADILKDIYPLISAEREYFKLAKLELFSFPRYYWQAFGEQKHFELEIKQDGQLRRYQIKAVDAIEGYESKRNEVFFGTRELQYVEQAAYLRPGNFGGDEQQYRQFIDSCFIDIKKKNVPHLIIDLRNNLGGDDSFSNYLVSYIADQPFRWCSAFSLKTSAILKTHVRETYDTTNLFWKSALTHKDGTIYPYEFEMQEPKPEAERYSGKVYVLINRQSHSQAAVTASQIQDYKFATLVGEETGDFPSLYASQYGYALPNTGIEVKNAKGYIVRVNGSKKEEGVIPDILIRDHLLDEEDEVLEGLLDILRKK